MILSRLWVVATVIGLLGCATVGPPTSPSDSFHISQLKQLLPADAILMGEQHDAPDHQRLHRMVVETLATQQTLAALALEMASQGASTEKLKPDATEDQVRAALLWDLEAWPWTAYGPAVMVAVRAGVPVLGANLPAARLREAMANTGLDSLLPGPALKAQQQNIRLGHCELLPESQISPMTRVQIARDLSMAQTVALAARPGKTVVLLAGNGHADRTLGVPLHLPPEFIVKTVLLRADNVSDATRNRAAFDQTWPAKPAPIIDYCANFKAQQARQRPATIQK
ncbi:MAG: ChaN family lipoprotein [Rhodoferax sp.]|nr:ChaN family lipoprotein [Rhodoferax sp.]